MERAPLPRPPASPLRTTPKVRLCAAISPDDVAKNRITVTPPNQIHLSGSVKSHSKNAFDNVFAATAQNDTTTALLPELLHSLFNGNDCSFLAFGAKSKYKESLIYGGETNPVGMLQTCVESIFRIMEETKAQRGDVRFQLRLSALLYSQRENTLTDQLSTFNNDPRRRSVRIAEDSRAGTMDVEFESEIRVETPDQALFYLNTVADHRIIEDDGTYRTNHLFIFFSLYSYRTGGTELEGGRRRFCFVDLGIGARNSAHGEMTMPVLGGILLALLQGQKQLPLRENVLAQLLRCSLSSSKLCTMLCTFGSKTDDNENVLQLVSKLARVKQRTHAKHSETNSTSSGKRSELESGSEMSAAETVIYVGPRPLHRSPALTIRSPSVCSKLTQTSGSSDRTCTGSIPPILKGHTPFLSATLRLYDDLCSPPGTSRDAGATTAAFAGWSNEAPNDYGITIVPPKKSHSKQNLNEEKRQAIQEWVEMCEPLPGASDDDHIYKGGECAILSHPLEDIIEIDEESLRESLRSQKDSQCHPLRILSKEALNVSDENKERTAQDSDDDALERAMAASVSSIRSHDILVKLSQDLGLPKDLNVSTTDTPSEMDMYRRASHLEEYALERVRELDDVKMRRKKAKLNLNCCQNSMLSSASTLDWSKIERMKQNEKEKDEANRRKEELRARRERLKLEEHELRRERHQIDRELHDRSLPAALVRQISQQLQHLNFGAKPSMKKTISDSLPSTPTITPKRQIVPPARTPSLTNCTSILSTGIPPSPATKQRERSSGRKSSKVRTEKRERRSSDGCSEKEDVGFRSPYSKVTDPRGSSSGRCSDDASERAKGKKRQSYSASSGYESGAGDYHSFNRDARLERFRHVDKRLLLDREADNLREMQKQLKKDLLAAKARIGQLDDGRDICHETPSNGISQGTLVDTLLQENRILEKRLIACQNHTMLVTSFL